MFQHQKYMYLKISTCMRVCMASAQLMFDERLN